MVKTLLNHTLPQTVRQNVLVCWQTIQLSYILCCIISPVWQSKLPWLKYCFKRLSSVYQSIIIAELLSNILYCILLYLMNINKDILAFYWLRFVMWFNFIFHGMTTKSSKEVIIYHVFLHWPVDIDRLKKFKWRPINPVSIEIWNRLYYF